MLHRILVSALALAVTACAHVQRTGSATAPRSLPDNIREATVALVAYRGLEWRIFCSGVIVGEHYVLTALHCVDDSDGGPVHAGTLSGYQEADGAFVHAAIPHYVVKTDVEADLALLRTSHSYRVVARVGGTPYEGDHVWLVGHPAGLGWTVDDGVVSARDREECDAYGCSSWLQASAPAWYGNSGGGLWTDAGELVGIASHGGAGSSAGIVPHLVMFGHPRAIGRLLAAAIP